MPCSEYFRSSMELLRESDPEPVSSNPPRFAETVGLRTSWARSRQRAADWLLHPAGTLSLRRLTAPARSLDVGNGATIRRSVSDNTRRPRLGQLLLSLVTPIPRQTAVGGQHWTYPGSTFGQTWLTHPPIPTAPTPYPSPHRQSALACWVRPLRGVSLVAPNVPGQVTACLPSKSINICVELLSPSSTHPTLLSIGVEQYVR